MITIKNLLYLAFTFFLGIGIALFAQKIFSNETINFSSLNLITFTFSIALSGASIILAIAAIDLGKKSEQMMMIQNEESVHLQNEIFTKTNEALQKIGTSTGVTEKRIEDIISGRISNISENIANKMMDQQLVSKSDLSDLERNIRNSLIDELKKTTINYPQYSISSDLDKLEKDIERAKTKTEKEILIRKKYREYQQSIFYKLLNLGKYKILKMADGNMSTSGDDAVDGIFIKDDKRFAVCTFFNGLDFSSYTKRNTRDFIRTLSNEIAQKKFSKIFLVFSDKFDDTFVFKQAFDSLKNLIKPEVIENIILLAGNADEVIPIIEKNIG